MTRKRLILAVAALLTLGLAACDTPSSSPQVTIISSDTARLPQHANLEFYVSKHYWTLTWNGYSVHMHTSSLFGDTNITVPCPPGRTTPKYMGWGDGTFYFTPESGGWVRVYWPFGWDYQPS